jgi:hypothetical protein
MRDEAKHMIGNKLWPGKWLQEQQIDQFQMMMLQQNNFNA